MSQEISDLMNNVSSESTIALFNLEQIYKTNLIILILLASLCAALFFFLYICQFITQIKQRKRLQLVLNMLLSLSIIRNSKYIYLQLLKDYPNNTFLAVFYLMLSYFWAHTTLFNYLDFYLHELLEVEANLNERVHIDNEVYTMYLQRQRL